VRGIVLACLGLAVFGWWMMTKQPLDWQESLGCLGFASLLVTFGFMILRS
jgi:hypothetical protein